jgi:4-hydroxy-tetrahydrodipicolinate synthase
MISIQGVYTALITPFSQDCTEVDFTRLVEQIRFQASGGVSGIVPCGTTGESPTLSDDEHRRVVETAVDVARTLDLQVIAGAGSNSTAHAIELHRFAHRAGAHASLQVNPYYNKPSQEGLCRHFMSVAESCDLPIVLYNIPGRAAVGLQIDTIARLARHPNIVAIKEASGSLDLCSEIASRTELDLLSGDDSLTLPIMSVGGVGVVSVVSNIVPEKVVAMCEAMNSGDLRAARAAHRELLPLSRGLLGLDTNPIPVKAAMKELGRDTGSLRLPLVCASDAPRRAIISLLEQARLRRDAVHA